jgi:serine protease Do
MTRYPRARLGAAAVVAFVCGLYFASGADLTDFGWAQGKVAGSTQPSPKAIASLIETQDAFEAIAAKAKPAVVSIKVTKFVTRPVQPAQRVVPPNGGRGGQGRNRSLDSLPANLRDLLPPGLFGPGMVDPADPRGGGDDPVMGSGSGFIVTADGYILTNNHVVRDADVVTVRTIDKRDYTAKVIGRDPTTDIAVIKIDATNLPTLPMGNDANARVGQWVLAIGNPLDLDFTVTAGIISAKGRSQRELNMQMGGSASITDFIQTDAAINPGNSGGPLVDIHGNVIGINAAIESGTGYFAGYGFAIPITLAKDVMDDLVKYGKVRRAIIGVKIADIDQADAEAAGIKTVSGARVDGFTPDGDPDHSPAGRAGIRMGDVIVAANGQPVDKVSTLQRIIRGFEPDQTVDVDVVRYGEKKNFKIRLAELESASESAPNRLPRDGGGGASAVPSSAAAKRLGAEFAPVGTQGVGDLPLPAGQRTGLVVMDVSTRGPSFQKLIAFSPALMGRGSPSAMVIQKVVYPVQRDIKSVADLDQALNSVKPGTVAQFLVYIATDGPGAGPTLISIRLP